MQRERAKKTFKRLNQGALIVLSTLIFISLTIFPAYSQTRPEAGKSGCFIATAAFGSPMEQEVKVLSQLRDKFLMTNAPGQVIVEFYYKHSPVIADFIRDKESLRTIVRLMLRPLINISQVLIGIGE